MRNECAGDRGAPTRSPWSGDTRGTLVALLSAVALAACGEHVYVGGPFASDGGGVGAQADALDPARTDAATRDSTSGCCSAGESYGPSNAACASCCSGLVSVAIGNDVKCELPNRKVLLLIPVAGSLAVTDPANLRVQLVHELIQKYESDTTGPTTEIAVIAFASTLEVPTVGFTATPDLSAIDEMLSLADDLEDDDGALGVGFEILTTDMLKLSAAERAATSYVIVFFADGLPQPTCSVTTTTCGTGSCAPGSHCAPTTAAVDGGTRESYLCQPDYLVCTVPKVDWATAFSPPLSSSLYPTLLPNESYNTTPQLLADVNRIVQLKTLDHLGALSVSTVFLLAEGAITNSLAPTFYVDEPAPKALLQAMAQAGGGSFQVVSSSADLALTGTPSLQ